MNVLFDRKQVENRYHVAARTAVTGISVTLFNTAATFDSAGTTRGGHVYTRNPADIATLQALHLTNAGSAKLLVNEGVDNFA